MWLGARVHCHVAFAYKLTETESGLGARMRCQLVFAYKLTGTKWSGTPWGRFLSPFDVKGVGLFA